MRLTTDVRRSNEMTQRDEHKKKEIVNSSLAFVRCKNSSNKFYSISSLFYVVRFKCHLI